MEDTVKKAESSKKIETATQNIGLFFNASKTKARHLNLFVENHIHAMNGDEIEKVGDFLFWKATPTFQKTRIEKSWDVFNPLAKKLELSHYHGNES